MRVPLSWLREYVDLPATETGRDVQAKLVSAGLEVETVEHLGADLKGPLVVGQVLTIEELTEFKKPIRFCTVDVGQANGTGEPQEIVCGARNFAVGDKVVVVLPGATLPGGFSISARKTYGKTSPRHDLLRRRAGHGRRRHPRHHRAAAGDRGRQGRHRAAGTGRRGPGHRRHRQPRRLPVHPRRRPRDRHRATACRCATRPCSTCPARTPSATRCRSPTRSAATASPPAR